MNYYQQSVLCIDLDGTLLDSDMLVEAGFSFIKNKPHKVLSLFGWLKEGKAQLKAHLAESSGVDVEVLPYNQCVLQLIEQAKAEGKYVVLATATHRILAERVAEYLGCFDEVLSTDNGVNLSSHRKRELLVERFGEGEYDYVGNSTDDLEVWRHAKSAVVVNPERGVLARAREQANVTEVLETRQNQVRAWIKALRIHQWMKNLLVFVPLLVSHSLTEFSLLVDGILAFLFFGICASSVYLLNDLIDLNDDRHHRTKKHRPFASGSIPIKLGLLAFPGLLLLSFLGAWLLLPIEFVAVLLVYYVLTLTYSLWLKRYMAVDVIALASLYTIRIIAGAAALSLPLTFWILGFSIFIFLSLALVKRYAELNEARKLGKTERARGRGYYPSDLEMISSLGAASGYMSVMVLALYIQDDATRMLYSQPEIIWLACPVLLFWVTRVWLLTHRGEMHDDPVIFAVKDKVSILTGVLLGIIFFIAA
jgi:4-hydroxybenzoate polyprenyltransferase